MMMTWFLLIPAVLVPPTGQVSLLTNGSFESGLTGWTSATELASGATGACSYNVAVAPGVETATGDPGFPATDGTHILLGSVQSTTSSGFYIVSCVLYQDVAIPAGATTATATFDMAATIGISGDSAVQIGLYPTSSVPTWFAPPLAIGPWIDVPSASDTQLNHSGWTIPFDVSSLAGTTVRLTIISAAALTDVQVIGVDNVQFLASTSCAVGPGKAGTNCAPCAPGTYASVGGAPSCTACPPGSSSSFTGATSCVACPANTFASASGATSCQACPQNTYSAVGQNACASCPLEFIAAGPGSCSSDCPAGTFAADAGATSCTPCPPGTAPAVGQMACTVCPAGTFAPANGSTGCTSCPPGTYAAAPGSTSCVACGCNANNLSTTCDPALGCTPALEEAFAGGYFASNNGGSGGCSDLFNASGWLALPFLALALRGMRRPKKVG